MLLTKKKYIMVSDSICIPSETTPDDQVEEPDVVLDEVSDPIVMQDVNNGAEPRQLNRMTVQSTPATPITSPHPKILRRAKSVVTFGAVMYDR